MHQPRVQPWGEEKIIDNHYCELHVALAEQSGKPRRLNITFRVFDDGIGFRYRIPEQPGLHNIEIADEQTEFLLTGDHRTWWIPAYQHHRYEYCYSDSPMSQTNKVHTPVTFEAAKELYISIHEAALTDFASMTLCHKEGYAFVADLVPWWDGIRVRGQAPMTSPWRTIQIADTPGGLSESHLILNLNEPSKLQDASWIKPGKYVGIWWEMHLGKASWGAGPKRGVTTQNARKYIDFAAKHGFDGVPVEGWNKDWNGD